MPRSKGQTDDILVRIRRKLDPHFGTDPTMIDDPQCWIWKDGASVDRNGFPMLGNRSVRCVLWEHHTGMPIPVTPTFAGTTPAVYARTKCHKRCVNPWHHEWKSIRYAYDPEFPNESRYSEVPQLPTAPTVRSLASDITDWLEPADYERSFGELFAHMEMDFFEHSSDDLRNALTEVLKCPKA